MKKKKILKPKVRAAKSTQSKNKKVNWNFGEIKKKKFDDTPAFEMYVYGKTY